MTEPHFPHQQQENPLPSLNWRHRLPVRLNMAVFFVGLFSILFFSWVIWTRGKALLLIEADKLEKQRGQTLAAKLTNSLNKTEFLTVGLSKVFQNNIGDEGQIRNLIPEMLSPKGSEKLIAGGGIWPEPFKFFPNRKRSSFFWGRNEKGDLKFFDDYNREEGFGYHEEEWLVPARKGLMDKCYWSKSYMDPYSFEPMTTCAVPAYKNKELIGVASIDLKLSGVQDFFKEATKEFGGYAFAVDRNNRFLSFPKMDLVMNKHRDDQGNLRREFMNTWAFSEKSPTFKSIHLALDSINKELIEKALISPTLKKELEPLSNKLDAESYQIGPVEARLIAAHLLNQRKGGINSKTYEKHLILPNDPVLKTRVHVFIVLVPDTWWKVILVSPEARLHESVNTVLAWFYGVNTLFLILAMAAVSVVVSLAFLRPLGRTVKALEGLVTRPPDAEERLPEDFESEFALLNAAFNRRSDQLRAALMALEESKKNLEDKVKERTSELLSANEALLSEMEERQYLESERIRIQRELLETSRRAGMAEVATGVLHNVGNVLNSLNVSVTVLMDKLRKNKPENLGKAAVLLNQIIDLGPNPHSQEKGKKLVEYLEKLAAVQETDRLDAMKEFHILDQSIDHIKNIVAMQQSFARVSGISETVDLKEVMEYAITINGAGLSRHGVEIIREFEDLEPLMVEKQKVLQILINLLSNAKYALEHIPLEQRRIWARIRKKGESWVEIQVEDHGEGIPEENMVKIFTLGFTTREGGHGFGLHAAALAASEMGGNLSVKSDGPGKGAVFTLTLPYKKPPLEGKMGARK